MLDVAALKRNLATAARIKREAGCKILLATKALAMPAAFPLMRDTLDGTTASGEYEARMGREEFGKEVHVYAPAYAPGEVERLVDDRRPHLFQLARADRAPLPHRQGRRPAEVGIRINPGYSNATLGGALYDPVRALLALRHDPAPTSTGCRGTASTSSTPTRCARACTTARSD